MIMKKLKMSAALLALVGLASIGGIESSTPFIKSAMAQPGSRLCGYIATTQVPTSATTVGAGAMLIALEARDAGPNYTGWCNKIIQEVIGQIQGDALLSTMSWTKLDKATCESAGQYLTSATHGSNDMCDYMNSWGVYNVKKYNSPSQTTYSRTKEINPVLIP